MNTIEKHTLNILIIPVLTIFLAVNSGFAFNNTRYAKDSLNQDSTAVQNGDNSTSQKALSNDTSNYLLDQEIVENDRSNVYTETPEQKYTVVNDTSGYTIWDFDVKELPESKLAPMYNNQWGDKYSRNMTNGDDLDFDFIRIEL